MTNPVPFTNDAGQEIFPGDRVVAVSNSSHRLQTRVATYVGCSANGSPQVLLPTKRSYWAWGDTGERAKWVSFSQRNGRELVLKPEVIAITTMYNGKIFALK